jgi:hypothetical protein
MKAKVASIIICLLAFAPLGLAQSAVDGTWTGEVQGGRGPQMVTLTLKTEGGKLTGTVGGGRGGPVNIEDASLSGSTLKFKTKQMGRGGEIILNWTGTVKGEEIAFSRMAEGGQGQAQEFTLKKQK